MPYLTDPREEAAFWGPQFVEHAQFAAMMLVDPQARAAAAQLAAAAPSIAAGNSVEGVAALAGRLNAAMDPLLARLNAGEWLGFAYPSLVAHMVREQNWYLGAIQGRWTPRDLVCLLARDQGEAAGLAAKLTDPASQGVADALAARGDALARLAKLCRGAALARLAAQVTGEVAALDRFAKSPAFRQALKVLPPALGAHDLREGRWLAGRVQALRAARLIT